MSRIKGKDTKPELLVRRFLHAHGFRYRLHVKNLPGKPDIVLPKYRTVIFVHGCFWHGHTDCKYAVVPKTRTEWWTDKIGRTKVLDKENVCKLAAEGWKVLTIYECDLKSSKREAILYELITNIHRSLCRSRRAV